MGYLNANLWSVLAAAISAMFIGFLWYGPIFGRHWMKMMGFTEKSIKNMPLSAGQAMGLGFLAALVVSYGLAILIKMISVGTIASAIKVSLFVWIAFIVPVVMDGFLWEGKQFNLFAFNAAYRLVSLVVMATIIAIIG